MPLRGGEVTYQRECSGCGGRFDLSSFPLVFERQRERHRFFKRCYSCHSAQTIRSQRRGNRKHGLTYLQGKRRAAHAEAVRLGRTTETWDAWVRRQCALVRWVRGSVAAVRILPLRSRAMGGAHRGRRFPEFFYRMSSAERFTWRYENDATFAERQRTRTTMRRWLDTRYAVRAAGNATNRRYHDARDRQLGRVTRSYVRGEMTAKWCSYCLCDLTPDNRQLDHVVPISAGGMHDDMNIVAACQSCNASKGARSLLTWLVARAA